MTTERPPTEADKIRIAYDNWMESEGIPVHAAKAAVARAGQSLRDLRIAEISELDMQLRNGEVESYRAKVKVSFKYED